MSKPAAIILCGGESRRMGWPKAWLDFGAEKLLQRVVRLASAASDSVVVVAALGQPLPPLPPSVIVTRDALPGRGPLQGFLAGLTALPKAAEFAYVTSTDAPFLNPAWITLLRRVIGGDDLVIPYVDGRHHPLSALYRVRSIRPLVESLLAADQLKLQDLMTMARTRVVETTELATVDPDCRTLLNINSPDEYQEALGLAGISGPQTASGA